MVIFSNLRALFFLISIFCIPITGFASHSDFDWKDWKSAKNFYDSQDFSAAAQVLEAHSLPTANYFYNLGTIYSRMGRIGPSIAYLEKANRLQPHDPDIQYNLSVTRSLLGQKIGSDQLDPASTWIEQLADRVELNEVRSTLGLFGLITVLFWIRAYLKTRNLRGSILNTPALLGLIGFGIAASFYGIQRWANAYPAAVCLEDQPVRSGPGYHFSELSQVKEGSKIRLLGPASSESDTDVGSLPLQADASGTKSAEIWRQVRYSASGIGWVRSSGLFLP